MLLLLLNYVMLRALWKIGVYLISTLVNKSLYYYYYCYYYILNLDVDLLLTILMDFKSLFHKLHVHVYIIKCNRYKSTFT